MTEKLRVSPAVGKESSKSMPGIAGTGGAAGSAAPRATPSASGLKAGFSDDNAQFNYFVDFLQKYGEVPHFKYDISERLTVRVVDSAGKPVANAKMSASAGGKVLASGLTYSDGTWRLYPAALGTKADRFDVRAEFGRMSARLEVPRDGNRLVELRLQGQRTVPAPVPLDVLFVMDTTGSMGEEIERLKSTIEIIYANLAELKPRPLVRFGLVLYKDRGDEYITEIVPFTKDLEAFQAMLEPVDADGGGDGPEDLESALDDAVNKMDWNKDGLRLAFIVTDAEAHLDYNREYTYIDAANDARARAIKLHTIGTGGLPLEGEYLLRQVAQLTDSKYIFLTYGEGGEAEGGKEGSVSHHSGSNFQTDKLEAIIIRFVREEVANLSDTPLTTGEDYFSAQKIDDETRDQTLDKLFADAIGNLADYSTYLVTAETPCAVLPVSTSDQGLGPTAEYFGERLSMASAEARRWKTVERKDLQKILAELELQLSGLADEGSAAKVGQLLGADVLVAATLYKRADRYEIFLRLVRVSTAEVLAVSRAKLALDLGL
ncbi:MAG: hypothetical protein CVV51_06080 [Spirochaetae bacterium HGW-Spirochaetae-7]|nr:MAG: hypothetical protein CVV51_06080 [Spirochaetae bacterium HGW-Spirochaetae-7]